VIASVAAPGDTNLSDATGKMCWSYGPEVFAFSVSDEINV